VAEQDDKSPLTDGQMPPGEAAEDMAGAAETGPEALQAELEQVTRELADTREQMLRVAADAQNIRRRAEKDVEAARKFALERFVGELLPVVDNLERALEAADGDDPAVQPLLDGVDLTRKSFLDALRKFNVEQLDPTGEPFDPERHEAMSLVEQPGVAANTVLNVVQKGYVLNDRLLRAAMVVVARGGAGGGGKIDEQA